MLCPYLHSREHERKCGPDDYLDSKRNMKGNSVLCPYLHSREHERKCGPDGYLDSKHNNMIGYSVVRPYLHSREHERKCGPDGYLDSKRYTNTFLVRQSKEKPPPGGADGGGKPRSTVDLIAKTDKDRREFDKRMKVIEVRIIILHQARVGGIEISNLKLSTAAFIMFLEVIQKFQIIF